MIKTAELTKLLLKYRNKDMNKKSFLQETYDSAFKDELEKIAEEDRESTGRKVGRIAATTAAIPAGGAVGMLGGALTGDTTASIQARKYGKMPKAQAIKELGLHTKYLPKGTIIVPVKMPPSLGGLVRQVPYESFNPKRWAIRYKYDNFGKSLGGAALGLMAGAAALPYITNKLMKKKVKKD